MYTLNLPLLYYVVYVYARAAFPTDTHKFLYISCICPLPDDGPEMDEISLR